MDRYCFGNQRAAAAFANEEEEIEQVEEIAPPVENSPIPTPMQLQRDRLLVAIKKFLQIKRYMTMLYAFSSFFFFILF